jgi:hypothetical protein
VETTESCAAGRWGGPVTPVNQILICCCGKDTRKAFIAAASVRYWYPEAPIFLAVDHGLGEPDLRRLLALPGVRVLPLQRKQLGYYVALEAMLGAPAGRSLLLDADTVLAGPVLDKLAACPEPLVVERVSNWEQPLEYREKWYFSARHIQSLDPHFEMPEFCFNTGQLAFDRGVLQRGDFAGLVDWSEPVRVFRPEVFPAFDQSLLNYVVWKKVRAGQLELGFCPDMLLWAKLENIDWAGLLDGARRRQGVPAVVHWAGVHHEDWLNTGKELLMFYEMEGIRMIRGRMPLQPL